MKTYATLRGREAWTLVELLVAFAVVSVLLVISLGVFSRATSHSKGAINVNHHRQIAAALTAYAMDHQGNLPWATEAEGSSTRKVYSRILTAGGYITNAEVFFSPWAKGWWKTGSLSSVLRKPNNENLNPWYYTNYGVNRNGAMPRRGLDNAKKRPANLSRMAGDGVLSKMMLLRDVFDTSSRERGGGIAWFSKNVHLPTAEERNGYGFVHASFADGHVEAYTFEQYQAFDVASEAPFYEGIYVW